MIFYCFGFASSGQESFLQNGLVNKSNDLIIMVLKAKFKNY